MNARLPQSKNPVELLNLENTEATSESSESLKPEDQKRERADLAMSVMEETPPQAVLDRAELLREEAEKGEKPKEWSWMPTAVKVGVGLGAAYLTWSILSKFWNKKEKSEEKEEEGFFSTAEKIVGVATLGGLAYLVGKEAIPGFFKDKWDLEAKKESVEKFIDKVKEGKFMEAFSELSVDSEEPYLERSAKEIDVEKKYIVNVRDVKYTEFLKHRKEKIAGKIGYATMQIAEMVGIDLDKNIPFTSADDKLREANADAKIQAYLEKNTSEEDRKELSIGELLKRVVAQKNPDLASVEAKNGESQTTSREAGTGYIGESDSETGASKISEDPSYLKEHAKNTSALIETWSKENPEGQSTTVYQKAGDLVDAAKEDGGQIFTYDGSVYLLKGSAVMLLSSCAFFADTIADVGMAAATEEKTAGDVVTSFLERGGLTFVGTGMAIGAAVAGLQKIGLLDGSGSVIKEAFKGGLKGIIAPYNIFRGTTVAAKAVYSGAQWISDQYKFATFSAKELLDPKNALLYKQGKAAWAAEEFLKTFEEANLEKTARWNWEGIKAKAKASILPENIKQLRTRYLDWFLSSRREYLKAANITDDFVWHYSLKDADLTEGAKEAHRFLAEVKASNSAAALRTLSETTNRPAGIETPRAKIERLRSMAQKSDRYMRTAIDERESMVRRKIRGSELDAFDTQVRDHLKTSGREAEALLDELSRGTLSMEDKVLLNSIVRKELSASLGIKAVVKEVKGRGKAAIVIGTGYAVYEAYQANKDGKDLLIDGELTELGEQIGWEALATIINVMCPFGGTDFWTAATGEEIITGRKLEGWERALRLGMGTYSAVTDTIGVLAAVATSPAAGTGGVGVYAGANAVEAAVRLGLRGLGASDDIINTGTRLVPRLTELAQKVGGYKELLLRMQRVAHGTGLAMTGATVAFMGYTVLFDTRDSKTIELASVEAPVGEASVSSTSTTNGPSIPANNAPSESSENSAGKSVA